MARQPGCPPDAGRIQGKKFTGAFRHWAGRGFLPVYFPLVPREGNAYKFRVGYYFRTVQRVRDTIPFAELQREGAKPNKT